MTQLETPLTYPLGPPPLQKIHDAFLNQFSDKIYERDLTSASLLNERLDNPPPLLLDN